MTPSAAHALPSVHLNIPRGRHCRAPLVRATNDDEDGALAKVRETDPAWRNPQCLAVWRPRTLFFSFFSKFNRLDMRPRMTSVRRTTEPGLSGRIPHLRVHASSGRRSLAQADAVSPARRPGMTIIVAAMVATSFSSVPVIAQHLPSVKVSVFPALITRPSNRKRSPMA